GGQRPVPLRPRARAACVRPAPRRAHVLLVRPLPARPGPRARHRGPHLSRRVGRPRRRARHGRPAGPGRRPALVPSSPFWTADVVKNSAFRGPERNALGSAAITSARSLLAAAGDAQLDEPRKLKPEELAALSVV